MDKKASFSLNFKEFEAFYMVSQEGFGPQTLALKERYSTAELLARHFTRAAADAAKRHLKIIKKRVLRAMFPGKEMVIMRGLVPAGPAELRLL